jgi:hypothetical protein
MLARNHDAGAGFFIRAGARLGTTMTDTTCRKIDIFCGKGSTRLKKTRFHGVRAPEKITTPSV